jgi:fumarylacetoacetate (FAA) hydrolase
MKLATLADGSRDGQLIVVARNLASAHHAAGIAGTLQQLLDDWNFISPQLEALYAALNGGTCRHAFAFDPRACTAPLPRAYRWVRAAAGAPLFQGAGDDLLGPHDDAVFVGEGEGIVCGAGPVVVTGDVARGVAPAAALEGVRLLMLVNDWSLSDPGAAAAFGPLAVTPEELGDAWRGGRVHLTLRLACNGVQAAVGEAGPGPQHHFGQLIARLAQSRRVRAGSIVGSGAPGGTPPTAALQAGDTIRIEMSGRDGGSIFGAIEQRVVRLPS